MSDATALLAAIRAAPEDDAPRLVYSDWLEEHGQPERAEFIRIQCERARGPNPALHEREDRLWNAHHDKLAGPFAAPGVRYLFERGLIAGFGHTGVFVAGTPSANHMFRFYPDGHLITLRHYRPPHEVIQRFRRGFPGHHQGTYTLSAFSPPGELRLVYRQYKSEVEYGGSFEPPWLVFKGSVGGIHEEVRYKHFPIQGADTFTET